MARISENYDLLCQKAYNLLRDYAKAHDKKVNAKEYAKDLINKIREYSLEKIISKDRFESVIKFFEGIDLATDEIICTFSHGDLQSGNIWIENVTDKIYIIDWESWGERSIWYDKAVLFDGLRPKGIEFYMSRYIPEEEKNIVVLEDIIFRLNELYSLPDMFGADDFDEYIGKIFDYLKI